MKKSATEIVFIVGVVVFAVGACLASVLLSAIGLGLFFGGFGNILSAAFICGIVVASVALAFGIAALIVFFVSKYGRRKKK